MAGVKLIVIYPRPKNIEEFEQKYQNEHVPMAVEKLNGKTKMSAAVMPYYTISYGRDTKDKENEGNSYNKYLITNLLREKYHYDGVVCTDWGVTADEGKKPDEFLGKSWGMETKTVAERHYKILMAGVDQFGGNNAAVEEPKNATISRISCLGA